MTSWSKPTRAERKADRYARAIARQKRLIHRGYYLRLHDTEPRFVTCTPAPIGEFLREADR